MFLNRINRKCQLKYLLAVYIVLLLCFGQSKKLLGNPCIDFLEQVPVSCDELGNIADFNNDYTVDFKDFIFFAGTWWREDCQEPDWCSGCDLDQSVQVNFVDLKILVENWLWPKPIQWLIGQQNPVTGLVVSYEGDGKDFAYTFDQAIAIMAFAGSGERDKAQMILDRMYLLQQQISNGAWNEWYIASDPNIICAGSEKYVTGPIAWMVMAINYYEAKTNDDSYASMAREALSWLDTVRNIESNEKYGSLRWCTGDNCTPVEAAMISTEHNLDAYSAYYWRGIIDSNTLYIIRASDILDYLCQEMWAPSPNSNGPYHDVNIFWEGFDNFAFSTDPQTWGVLSLGPIGPKGEEFYKCLDWLWYSPWGNTRTTQNLCDEINVQGFKSGTGEPNDYVWVDGTEHAVAAYYSLGDYERGDFFFNHMKRVISSNSGLMHSFRQDEPNNVSWKRKNYRFNYVASTVWHYFNQREINPFVPYPVHPYPRCWASCTQCHGDADCDGSIDDNDLSELYISYNSSFPDPSYNPCADFNRDGTINVADLSILMGYFNTTPPTDCIPGSPWPPL